MNIFMPGKPGVPFDSNYYIICWTNEGQLNFESIKFFYPECKYINCISANPLREEAKHFFMPPQKTLRYVFGPPPQPKKLTYRGGRKLTGATLRKLSQQHHRKNPKQRLWRDREEKTRKTQTQMKKRSDNMSSVCVGSALQTPLSALSASLGL